MLGLQPAALLPSQPSRTCFSIIYAEEEMESDGDEDVYALLNRAASLASTRQVRPPHLPLACCRVSSPPAPRPAALAQHQEQQPWHAQLDRHMPSLPDRTSVCPTFRPQIQQFPLLRDWTPPVMRHELAAELR